MNIAPRVSTKLMLFPSIGILIFFGLFYYASTLYPGGSQFNSSSIAYDWYHNYWCDLTSRMARNKEVNPARNFAISGMIILCVSMLILFIQFGKIHIMHKSFRLIYNASAILSMLTASLIFTRFHDSMTIISSIFGLLVVGTIIYYVYQSRVRWLQISALLCVCILLANNTIYYSNYGIEYLPIIQKVSFIFVLIWMLALNLYLWNLNYQKKINRQSNKL